MKPRRLAADGPSESGIQFPGLPYVGPETRHTFRTGASRVTEVAVRRGLLRHPTWIDRIALDPGFANNQWIWLYYSPTNAAENRLSRFTLRGEHLDRESEKIVLRVATQRDICCHAAGSLAFDGQGNLFLSTGDNTNPFESEGFAPIDDRPGRYPWDASKSSANTADLRGKILRIHPEPDGSYTIPAGNLFPPGTPKTRPEIFVMGCRNPFRISVDRTTQTLYWGEVGPDAQALLADRGPAGFDEVNRTKVAGNFGWPFFVTLVRFTS